MGPTRPPSPATGLLLVPLAFLLGVPVPPAAAPDAAAPAVHAAPPESVTVTFDSRSHRIQVTKDPIRITPGQEITWNAGSGVVALAIDIPSPRDPFGASVRANGVRARKGGPPARVQARQGDQFKGTYKYTVAIYDGQQVWILDPDIIIN